MPRARTIFRHDVALEPIFGDITFFMRTGRALRRQCWDHASETLGLDQEAGLAFVRMEEGLFMHERCHRALVLCPYRPGLNEDLKTLGQTRIRYESRYRSWVVRVDDEESIMRVVRKLLKFLSGVILQTGSEAALLSHQEQWVIPNQGRTRPRAFASPPASSSGRKQ